MTKRETRIYPAFHRLMRQAGYFSVSEVVLICRVTPRGAARLLAEYWRRNPRLERYEHQRKANKAWGSYY